jgi:DNA-binding CsgD family transcriptional regulator
VPRLIRLAQDAGLTTLVNAAGEAANRLAERNPQIASLVGIAAHSRGLLYGELADLRRAVQVLRAAPRPLATAGALEDLALAEHGRGNRDEAVDLMDQALRMYAGCGAKRDVARAQKGLRDLGVRRRLRQPTAVRNAGWESLTQSELRVVRLVAEGLTNRQVAAQLFVSPHTVDSHLRHSFSKLGVTSRVELTRQVLTHDRADEPATGE